MPRDFDMETDEYGDILVRPLNPHAEAFLRDAVSPQATWRHEALVVRWPFIQGVKRVIRNAGYKLREDE